MKKLLTGFLSLAVGCLVAQTVFQSNFTKGAGPFTPYANGSLEVRDGVLSVGKGAQFTVRVPSDARCRVSAEIAGSGRMQIAIFGKPGASYSAPLVLTENVFKTISMDYHECSGTLGVTFFRTGGGDGPVKIKNVRVETVPVATHDVEVAPVAFEAEDFSGANGWLRKEGATVYRSGQRWYVPVMNVPAPATSRALYAYLRVRKHGTGKVTVELARERQALASAAVVSDQFAYLKLGPISGAACVPAVSIRVGGDPKIDVDIDRIVWSSRDNLTAAGLDAVKASAPVPVVTAFPVAQAPAVDGKFDEAAWKNTVEIAPFRLNQSNTFAKEQTSVRLGYDNNNLYVAFHAVESALNPTAQRLHEFQNKVKAPDFRGCYNDDVVIVILKRPGESFTHEYVVNASGVVTASQSAGPDFWTTRKLFSGKAKAAGHIGNGFYNVEIAIPWAELGGVPKAGEKAQIMLGRIEKSRKEASAFSAIKVGFHNLADFADLHFAKKATGGSFVKMPGFQSGTNRMEFTSNALRHTRIGMGGKSHHFVNYDGTFGLHASGEFDFAFALLDPATLEPLLRMPAVRQRTRAAALGFKAVPGVEVTLNGAAIQPGAALSSGSNQLAVSGKDAAKMVFNIGEYRFAVDKSWKETAGTFRKNLLLEHSMVWPDWTKEGVSIPAGSVQQILFIPRPPEGVKLKDYTFYIDLPVGFKLEGASGYYKYYPLTVSPAGAVRHSNKEYQRYAIRINREIALEPALQSHLYISMVIRAPQQPNRNDVFYFHSGSEAGAVSEVPQECKLTIIPAINGKLPKTMRTQFWMGWLHNMDNRKVADAILTEVKKAGTNEVNSLNGVGLKTFRLINFADWNLNLSEYLKKRPDAKLEPINKQAYTESFMCPTVMTTDKDFTKWLDTAYVKWYERMKKPEIVCWDYEHGAYALYLNCACKRCLERFAKFANLKTVPAASEIRAKYHKQWVEFMTTRMAEVADMFYKQIKKHTPKAEFNIYSGYECEQTKSQYGVDWKKCAPFMDFGGAGYGRPIQDIRATCDAVRPKPMVMGVIAYPYEHLSRQVPTICSAARMMQAMLDSTGGILIYAYATLDGRTVQALGEVNRVVAENEPFFIMGGRDGKQFVSASGTESFARVDQKGNVLLVFVNTTQNQLRCKGSFKVPGVIVDCLSGKTVQSVDFTLAPGSFAAYRLNKK